MLDEPTSRVIRQLVKNLDSYGGRIPVGGLVQLVETAGADLSIDASADPPLVAVGRRRHPVFDRLSRRELEVAALVAAGLRNRVIGERLFISLGTVKDHVHAILTKTGLEGRAAVIAKWNDVVSPIEARRPGG